MLSGKNVALEIGAVVIGGANVDAQQHRHRALQLILPQPNSVFTLNNQPYSSAVVIASAVHHQLHMSAGWLILMEPESAIGQYFQQQLNGKRWQILPDFPLAQLTVLTCAEQVYLKLSQLVTTDSAVSLSPALDSRIAQLLAQLDLCLQGTCLKPASWRAKAVAEQLALSESRFLHLFRQEMQIAWRPYLLWRRLLCAIQGMVLGKSATDAAYQAGFADSAHLSRSFKQTFGMTIRQAETIFVENTEEDSSG